MRPLRCHPGLHEEESLLTLFASGPKVTAQNAAIWRSIFIDDGSHGRSWQAIEQLAIQDPRVRRHPVPA